MSFELNSYVIMDFQCKIRYTFELLKRISKSLQGNFFSKKLVFESLPTDQEKPFYDKKFIGAFNSKIELRGHVPPINNNKKTPP